MKSSERQPILMVIVHFVVVSIYVKIDSKLSEREETLGADSICKEKEGNAQAAGLSGSNPSEKKRESSPLGVPEII